MSLPTSPVLDATALLNLARAADASGTVPCERCAPLQRPGWESVSGRDDLSRLQDLGSLQDPAVDEPTLAEHHPDGTHAWSEQAPIAPAWFPYNRCALWRCADCGGLFLRYTEYGGYYQDERIRPLQAALIVDVPPP